MNKMTESFDILIVGGGVVGSSTAYHLAELSNSKVGLIERSQICSGGTARSCAIVRSHYSVPSNTALTVKSIEIFRNFNKYLGDSSLESGFVQSGYLILAPEGETSDKLVENLKMQKKIGAETLQVSHKEALEFHPLLNLNDIGAVGYEPFSGYADPYLTTTGFANAAKRQGVELITNQGVIKLLTKGNKVIGVDTESGVIHAGLIILSTGPWIKDLTDPLNIDTYLDISRHSVITLKSESEYDFKLPIIKDLSTKNKMYFRPSSGGVVLVGTGDHGDPIQHPDLMNEEIVDDFIINQGRQISNRMPSFKNARVTNDWVGAYDITPDWNPVLGEPDGWEGLILAYGFSGHGFKMAPAVGKMLAQKAVGIKQDIDISPYSHSRFKEDLLLSGAYGIGSIS